jgi:hypothetical protein
MIVATPQLCSCSMGCGNARAYYGRKLKEIIHQINLKEGTCDVVNYRSM